MLRPPKTAQKHAKRTKEPHPKGRSTRPQLLPSHLAFQEALLIGFRPFAFEEAPQKALEPRGPRTAVAPHRDEAPVLALLRQQGRHLLPGGLQEAAHEGVLEDLVAMGAARRQPLVGPLRRCQAREQHLASSGAVEPLGGGRQGTGDAQLGGQRLGVSRGDHGALTGLVGFSWVLPCCPCFLLGFQWYFHAFSMSFHGF